jgi:hypothetical protein
VVHLQHGLGSLGYTEPDTFMKIEKIDRIITELNYAVCLVYMFFLLIFPDKSYSADIFDWLLLIYLYTSTAILIFLKARKKIWS